MTILEAGAPRPFKVEIEEAALEDLKQRLANTRWPEAETVSDWSQGAPLDFMQSICRYWAEEYDWRRCEAEINQWPGFLTEIDGLDIHFLHIRSSNADARPLILTHGWPGSIIEFLEIIPLLTEPQAHGGEASDAFHVVAPSLPGFGFSGKPAKTGWSVEKTADAWAALMARLGYDAYFAQGGDWGSFVSTALAMRHGEHCKGVHLNLVLAPLSKEVTEAPTKQEALALVATAKHQKEGAGYAMQQSTRPQTLGYGITDSPAGQAAWILEKFFYWTDNPGTPDAVASRDKLLDNVMLYWLTASAASSARLYWESYVDPDLSPVKAPVGCVIFPKEIITPSKRWAENRFHNIVHWSEAPRGGHFAALEEPEFLARDIRACFRKMALD